MLKIAIEGLNVDQDAVQAVMEATGYSPEEAFGIVERGEYTLYRNCL